MMLREINHQEVKGTWDGEQYDMDVYDVHIRRAMSTHEITLTVSHLDKEVSGTAIRYGEWGDIDEEEAADILQLIIEEGQLVRPAEGYTIKG